MHISPQGDRVWDTQIALEFDVVAGRMTIALQEMVFQMGQNRMSKEREGARPGRLLTMSKLTL